MKRCEHCDEELITDLADWEQVYWHKRGFHDKFCFYDYTLERLEK